MSLSYSLPTLLACSTTSDMLIAMNLPYHLIKTLKFYKTNNYIIQKTTISNNKK